MKLNKIEFFITQGVYDLHITVVYSKLQSDDYTQTISFRRTDGAMRTLRSRGSISPAKIMRMANKALPPVPKSKIIFNDIKNTNGKQSGV